MQKRKVKGMLVIECFFFFLSRHLKSVRPTMNSYLLSFFCCPRPRLLSVYYHNVNKISSSFIVLFCLALSDGRKK